jgi:hypothetical protein
MEFADAAKRISEWQDAEPALMRDNRSDQKRVAAHDRAQRSPLSENLASRAQEFRHYPLRGEKPRKRASEVTRRRAPPLTLLVARSRQQAPTGRACCVRIFVDMGTFWLARRCFNISKTQDTCMLDPAHARAESFFERRQRQATEGEQAWSEYKAKEAASVANLERLRKLRQAREAEMTTRARRPRVAKMAAAPRVAMKRAS